MDNSESQRRQQASGITRLVCRFPRTPPSQQESDEPLGKAAPYDGRVKLEVVDEGVMVPQPYMGQTREP